MNNASKETNLKNIYDKFGKYYDILYDNFIDYNSDCNYIEEIIKRFYKIPEKVEKKSSIEILDIGCGTGNHALELARRGYYVTGLDTSEASLNCAKTKLSEEQYLKNKVDFLIQDYREINFNKKFDVITALFGVLSYLPENQDLLEILIKFKDHLKPNGLFMGEIWQYSGVIPGFKDISSGKDTTKGFDLIRRAESRKTENPDIIEIEMNFQLKDLKKGDIVDTFTEFHYLQAYELEDFKNKITAAQFQLLGFYNADSKTKDFLEVKSDTLRTFFIAQGV